MTNRFLSVGYDSIAKLYKKNLYYSSIGFLLMTLIA